MKTNMYNDRTKLDAMGMHEQNAAIDQTFNDLVSCWIDEQKGALKPNSINKYNFLLEKHIIPKLGDLKIQEINNGQIKNFIDDMSKSGRIDNCGGLSGSTVNDMVVLIKSILGYAQEKYNVNLNIGKIKVFQKRQVRNRFFTKEDISTLVASAWNRYNVDHSDLRCLGVLLCMYTGVRISELCALRWSDIDVKRGILFINNSLQRIRKGKDCDNKTALVIDAPKTEKSTRIIPIRSNILEKLYEIQPLYSSNDFLLSGKKDKAIEPRNMQYYFKQLQLAAGIEPLCFHSLRHTFASMCIQSGMDVKTLSEILGHSNINITLSYYVHSSIEQKLKQIEAVDY